MLVLLSEDRKVVLSHHKTFEHVEKIIFMNKKILENLEQLKKMLVLLSGDRKVVLSHHKTFEHVEKMRAIVNESIEMANNHE